MSALHHDPRFFEDMDPATAELILQIQFDEIRDLRTQVREIRNRDQNSDTEFALNVFQQELDSVHTLFYDRRVTESIANAVQQDANCLSRARQDEERSRADHALAHQLNGSRPTPIVRSNPDAVNDTTLAKLAGRYVSEQAWRDIVAGQRVMNENQAGNAVSSAQAADQMSALREGRITTVQCIACQEQRKFFDTLEAPCQHSYCVDCIRDLFERAMRDETLFPPRCCRQNIDVETLDIFLTKELKEGFQKKKIEFSTKDRTYCFQPDCSKFINPININNNIAICSDCGLSTCSICKAQAHDGDCPADSATQQTLELAREAGWQRCFQCHRLVELDHGCNHMT